MDRDKFRTFRGYSMESREEGDLTPSMEDYLEMIYRIAGESGYARVNDLALALNVQPSSASKMVRKLAEQGHLKYEPYGILVLTDSGREAGRLLLERHEILATFLELLGVRANLLQDTERIEHLVSEETLGCIASFVEFAAQNPGWLEPFHRYLHEKGGR